MPLAGLQSRYDVHVHTHTVLDGECTCTCPRQSQRGRLSWAPRGPLVKPGPSFGKSERRSLAASLEYMVTSRKELLKRLWASRSCSSDSESCCAHHFAVMLGLPYKEGSSGPKIRVLWTDRRGLLAAQEWPEDPVGGRGIQGRNESQRSIRQLRSQSVTKDLPDDLSSSSHELEIVLQSFVLCSVEIFSRRTCAWSCVTDKRLRFAGRVLSP